MSFCYAQEYSAVMVDGDGVVKYPSNFATANNFSSSSMSTSNLSVMVDLYRDGMDDVGDNDYNNTSVYGSYYSECLVKVLGVDGSLLYVFSTVVYFSEQVQSMHAGEDIYDTDATCYYFVTGRNNYVVQDNNRLRAKQLFPSSAWSTHCIATYEQSLSGQSVYSGITKCNDSKIRITGIQIYPSARFRDLFTNPENTIIVHRQSVSTAEVDGMGNHLFKPAILQY